MQKNKLVSLEEYERSYITKVLEATRWKISGKNSAAEILGLKKSTLASRMQKLEITRPKLDSTDDI